MRLKLDDRQYLPVGEGKTSPSGLVPASCPARAAWMRAAAGGSHRPGNPPGHGSRLARLPRSRPAVRALCSLALERLRVRVYLAGPPAKAPAGNLNRRGEARPAGQFVGGDPAELEQRADVSDADQPVGARPPLPGGFRFAGSRACTIWQGHGPDARRSTRGSQ
ncbi:MAG: hypothetical protein ACRDNW_02465 [Trebonia sp.]